MVNTVTSHAFIVLSIFLLAITAPGCASSWKRIEIKSAPTAAEVTSLRGEKVGVTPFVITPEAMRKLASGGRIALMLSAPGHFPRELVIESHGDDSYEMKLTKLDADYFAIQVASDYAAETNAFVRDLLHIQGLLAFKKYTEAERAIHEFQKKFPSVASTYVMLASLETLKGAPDRAKALLERAQAIDPKDPVVARILGTVKTGTRKPGATQP